MAPTYRLTGSIVLYENEPDTVRRSINSFLGLTFSKKLYCLDNSRESPLDIIADEYKGSELVYRAMDRNVGYGAGHNYALRACLDESPYHLIMNPDIWFEPGTLEALIDYLDRNADVGLVMPQIRSTDGQIQYLCKLLPTPTDLFIRRFLPDLAILRPRKERFELRQTGYNREMNVPYLSGCFMLLRTAVLKQIGLFDERFFLYLEDTDLSRRVHAVARTMFYPEACVYHGYGQGSYKNLSLLVRHLGSACSYFNKWGWFRDRERSLINRAVLAETENR
ncbi:glycosyltransferase family 2 protein [bacterium]|nr:glycosyltransferase family 2 protein [bacterium]